METRHPIGGPFSREFSPFLIIAELWRPKVAMVSAHKNISRWRCRRFLCSAYLASFRACWNFLSNICVFFGKTTPCGKIFKILFRVHSPPHRSTLLFSNVIKFFKREIAGIVRYLPDKKFRIPLKLSLLLGSRPKPDGAIPTIWLTMFQISSKSVHFFGAVIAEGAKAVLLARTASPWLASRRIINVQQSRHFLSVRKSSDNSETIEMQNQFKPAQRTVPSPWTCSATEHNSSSSKY